MALLDCNGLQVNEGTLTLPRSGAWTAELLVDSPVPIAGAVTLATSDGLLTLAGTAVRGRSGEFITSAMLRVVAGAGGLATVATPKFYRAASLKIILGDLLSDAGETLSPDADAATLALQVPSWTTTAQPVGQVLGLLLEVAAPAASWRMLPDGTFWCGPETWPAIGAWDYLVLERYPSEARMLVGADALVPLPGQSLPTGEHLSYVEHTLGAEGARTMLWWE